MASNIDLPETSPRRSRSAQYSDIDANFTANLNTGDVGVRRDIDAVKQAVINIITTQQGEKVFKPAFGANLLGYPLFENFDTINQTVIRQDIIFALENFEPRVRVDNVDFEMLPDQESIRITIEFTIISPSNESASVSEVVQRVR